MSNPPPPSRSSSGISLLTRVRGRGISVRDGQFSNTRVIFVHVEPNEPTVAIPDVSSVEHVVHSQPTSANMSVFEHVAPSTSAVSSSSARSSSEPFSSEHAPMCPMLMRPGIVLPAQLAHSDAANSMHHPSSGTARLKRSGNDRAHAPVKRACLSSGPKRAKRGLKRTASDLVEAINRLRAARSTPHALIDSKLRATFLFY